MSHLYRCRHCEAEISLADVNVASDLALCRSCGKTMSFSEITPILGGSDLDLQNPPKGVRLEDSAIHGQKIIFKKISPVVFFLIPFTAVWSGVSMVGIYGKQISEGKFDLTSSLFGLPFLVGTLALLGVIGFGLFGRWQISFPGGILEVALRMGPFVWTRRHIYDGTTRVSIYQSPSVRVNNQPQRVILVETQGKKLKFGTMIPEEPKTFIAEWVRRRIQL
jgi:hypothetical protein